MSFLSTLQTIPARAFAASTDIPDPLSPLLPIVHRFWQVFRAASRILTYVCSSGSSCFCSAICGGPLEYITYEFVPASPVGSCMSGSSNYAILLRLYASVIKKHTHIYMYIIHNCNLIYAPCDWKADSVTKTKMSIV